MRYLVAPDRKADGFEKKKKKKKKKKEKRKKRKRKGKERKEKGKGKGKERGKGGKGCVWREQSTVIRQLNALWVLNVVDW